MSGVVAAAEAAELRRMRRRGTLALAEREVVRVLRLWRQTIIPPVLVAVLFIVVFGVALGDQIRVVEGLEYTVFIVPGLVLMGVATSAFANNATSIYQARNEGFIEDPASSPMEPRHLLLGYLAGGAVRGVLIGVATLAVARIVVDYPLQRPLILASVLVLVAVGFAALGTIVGLTARSWESQNVVGTLVLQPLVFLGGVFYSVETLGEPWRTVSHANPIYHMVAAARTGLIGGAEVAPALPLALTALLAGVLLAGAWWCFRRGIGIRT